MLHEPLAISISPYVNLDDTTYHILCELVDAGIAYYIVARKYPGILASDAVLDNLHFTFEVVGRASGGANVYGNRRLEWGGAK